ncbi:hypothetical protein Patl1_06607 [Pistacia atlantica]|uniref:Uncharacterized protein n=1 Tax=Pistacia atlantica TaxID=434234 RepID=A0ACC1BW51_9ROSI|nr:hypothetical protein Patl1_06607 [Pistacia atlantica]
MVTRKRPTDLMFEGGLNLHNFAKMALPDRVMYIVDPVLLNEVEEDTATNRILVQERNIKRKECLISMVRVGVACSMEIPQDRMNITNVVHELQEVKNILLQPRTVLIRRGDFSSSLLCSISQPNGVKVEEGAKVEQPFWLAQELYLRQAVSINVPTCFNQKTRREIQADAKTVDLRSRCPYFYKFGCKIAPMIGDRTSGKMLLSTFRMRYKDFTKAHTVAYAVASKFLMYGLKSRKVSTNRDVYSLGILLLEMTTRKRPIDIMFEAGVNLVHIVDPILPNVDEEKTATNHRLKETVNNISKECLISIARIGVASSMESPHD